MEQKQNEGGGAPDSSTPASQVLPPENAPRDAQPQAPAWAPQFLSSAPKESVMAPAIATTVVGPSGGGKKSALKYIFITLGLLLGAAVIAAVVFVYLIFVRGSTVFGYSLPDKVWLQIIEGSGTVLAERSFKATYQDSGTFNFIPSEFARAIGEELPEEEQQKLDEDYSFILKDLGSSWSFDGYVNVKDPKKAKADVRLEGSLTNNSKTYSGSLDAKLIDVIGFVRYDYSNSIEALFKKVDEAIPETSSRVDKWKNKWLKYSNVAYSEDLSAPGFSPLQGARAKSRDAKRISDIRQMASALELYFNDHGGYPRSQDGKPVGLSGENGSFTYLGVLPTAPVPADGRCTDDFNTYTYTAMGNPTNSSFNNSTVQVYPDYKFVFCVGGKTGGYEAGNLVLTPSGIKGYAECQNDGCYKNEADIPEDPFVKLVKENRIFDIEGFKGITKVHGVYTVHYSLSLNEAKLKTIFMEGVKEGMDENLSEDDKKFLEYYEQVLDIFFEKWDVEQFEIWIGLFDRQVYKAVYKTNTISLIKTVDLVYKELTEGSLKEFVTGSENTYEEDSNINTSNDSKRLADMRQMASVLELYFNDNGGYPEASSGFPQGVVPTYIAQAPTAPPADGRCSDYYNKYWYAPSGEPYTGTSIDGAQVRAYPNYTYTFCFGSPISGYGSGVMEMSASGVRNVYECPEPGKCYTDGSDYATPDPGIVGVNEVQEEDSTDDDEKIVRVFIELFRKVPFDATATFEAGAKNFGKEKAIEEPNDAIDIEKELQKESDYYDPAPQPFST